MGIERHTDAARELFREWLNRTGYDRRACYEYDQLLQEMIAAALAEAERRALERAAKVADNYCTDENGKSALHPALAWSDEEKQWWQCGQLDGASAVSAAIRALIPEEGR